MEIKRNSWADILLTQAVVVKNQGKEIQFFANLKDAGAFIRHTYLLTPSEAKKVGITVESIANRGPKPGDVVFYDGTGPYQTEARSGVLELTAGDLMVTFHASAFRQHANVSISGGPAPWIHKDTDLQFNGIVPQNFWCWHRGYAGAGEGGNYTINVPCWWWNGHTYASEEAA